MRAPAPVLAAAVVLLVQAAVLPLLGYAYLAESMDRVLLDVLVRPVPFLVLALVGTVGLAVAAVGLMRREPWAKRASLITLTLAGLYLFVVFSNAVSLHYALKDFSSFSLFVLAYPMDLPDLRPYMAFAGAGALANVAGIVLLLRSSALAWLTPEPRESSEW